MQTGTYNIERLCLVAYGLMLSTQNITKLGGHFCILFTSIVSFNIVK